MNTFFAIFAVLIQYPAAALVPAGLFAVAFFVKKGPLAGLSSILWLLYTGYEFLMKFRVLCSGECNIRVDLLVLYPALFLVSIAAIVEFLARKRKSADGPA